MTDLESTLKDFLTTHEFMGRDKGAHFIVAFSGGQDSTALLYALAALKAENPNLKITPAYYWHPWRSLEEDFQVVHQHAKALGLSWVSLTPDLTCPKSEAAARQDRYTQLSKLASDIQARAILTAHHQDDQVETVLFRILRGTGLEGLGGIPESRDVPGYSNQAVPVIRPFLHLPKQVLTDYVHAKNLRYVQDPTNQDLKFRRNLVRHQVLPQLVSAFPHVKEALLHLATVSSGEMEIVSSKIESIWQDVYDAKTNALDETRFNQLALPFQRRIIRRFLEAAGIEAPFRRIEDIIAFMNGDGRDLSKPGLFSLGTDQFLHVYKNKMTVISPTKHKFEPLPVAVPGEVSHTVMRTTISIRQLTPEERMKPVDYKKIPPSQVYVDLSKLEVEELVLRNRLEGDRIKPLGMSSPIKLKRFLINKAIPRFERDAIPLVTNGQDVLWAVGIGISNDIRVVGKPTHVMTLTQVDKK